MHAYLESGKKRNTKIRENLHYPYNKGERIIFFHKCFLLSTLTLVIFHRVAFYLTGAEKTKTKNTLALQAKINTLAKLFEDDEIDRAEYIEGVSLLVASNK